MTCTCAKNAAKTAILPRKINLAAVKIPVRKKVRSTTLGSTFDFTGACGGTFFLAKANGLSSEFTSIVNAGSCTFTLFAVDRNGNTISGSEHTLTPNGILLRYSVGPAYNVMFRCNFGQGGRCVLRLSYC